MEHSSAVGPPPEAGAYPRGVAGAALQAQVVGSSWNVIGLAAIATAFKLLPPTVPITSPVDPAACHGQLPADPCVAGFETDESKSP
jgi:hypothetical protein